VQEFKGTLKIKCLKRDVCEREIDKQTKANSGRERSREER
jgi:hypothetical protein